MGFKQLLNGYENLGLGSLFAKLCWTRILDIQIPRLILCRRYIW